MISILCEHLNQCLCLLPWVGKVVELQFQFLAMLEGALDGRSGFVEAAGLAATARSHTPRSVPTHQPGRSGGEAVQLGTGDSEALRDHFHCSEGTAQRDILDPESRGSTDIHLVLGVKAMRENHLPC